MTDREKLIEVLSKYFDIGDSYAYNLTRDKNAFSVGTMSLEDFEEFDESTIGNIADYLLKNGVGVIVPPCKIGDVVYCIYGKNVEEDTVHSIYIDCWNELSIKLRWQRQRTKLEDFGKTVFLTKEEAEKALAERSKEK